MPASPRRVSSPSSAAACCGASSPAPSRRDCPPRRLWSKPPASFENEQRSIEFVLLDRAQAGEIPAPAPEVLAKYFEERQNLFRAPEYRKLVVVSLIPTEQARWMEISDADIKRAYEERRARYVTPERRHVQQIDFPNAEAASAAAERIAKGASFADIAKERGHNDKDIDLGTVTKAAIIDRPSADAAFALKEGEVSAPVQGRFGTVLVHVLKIEPEQVSSLEQVAGELKQDLATARAQDRGLRRSTTRSRMQRAERQAAGRNRRHAQAGGAYRSKRSTAPAAIPPACRSTFPMRSACCRWRLPPTSVSSAIRSNSRTATSGLTSWE